MILPNECQYIFRSVGPKASIFTVDFACFCLKNISPDLKAQDDTQNARPVHIFLMQEVQMPSAQVKQVRAAEEAAKLAKVGSQSARRDKNRLIYDRAIAPY